MSLNNTQCKVFGWNICQLVSFAAAFSIFLVKYSNMHCMRQTKHGHRYKWWERHSSQPTNVMRRRRSTKKQTYMLYENVGNQRASVVRTAARREYMATSYILLCSPHTQRTLNTYDIFNNNCSLHNTLSLFSVMEYVCKMYKIVDFIVCRPRSCSLLHILSHIHFVYIYLIYLLDSRQLS